MDQINFQDVQVCVADSGGQMLQAYKNILQNAGFRKVQLVDNVNELSGMLEGSAVDLLICNASLEGGDPSEKVAAMRRAELGSNPFVTVLFILDSSSKDHVSKLINCGADDIMVKPVTAGELTKRIVRMAMHRRPFVVTYNYVGPDRRKANSKREQGTQQIEVPNLLRMKASSSFRPATASKQIKETRDVIRNQMIERSAIQIAYQAEEAIKAFKVSFGGSRKNDIAHTHLNNILQMADALMPPLMQSVYAQEDIIINTAAEIARNVLQLPDPSAKDLVQVEKVATLIRKNFSSPAYAVA